PSSMCARDRAHVLVIAVDVLAGEVLLQAREVLVVLLVERGDEAVDALAVAVELGWRGSSGHGARRICGACTRSGSGRSGGRSWWRSRPTSRRRSTGTTPAPCSSSSRIRPRG